MSTVSCRRTATLNHEPTETHLTQLPARDLVAALACTGGDADLAAELFASLLAQLPSELESLRAYLARSDWTGLADQAHRLRGATRYCGVPALDEASEALERAAQIREPTLITRAFANLTEEAQRVQDAAD